MEEEADIAAALALSLQEQCQAQEAPAPEASDFLLEADDLTCAICLSAPAPVDLAIIKGCEHNYCVACILHWTLYKETPLCPQCKKPFNYLYVHRLLDGTIMDYAVEESVCLLKRATWFTEHIKMLEKGRALGANNYELGHGLYDQGSSLAYDLDDYDDDVDDDIENYYFSSAAGRARVVLGNRRFGENGFVRGGRRFARPLPNQSPAPAPAQASASAKKGKGAERGSGSGSAARGGDPPGTASSSNASGAVLSASEAAGMAGPSSSSSRAAGALPDAGVAAAEPQPAPSAARVQEGPASAASSGGPGATGSGGVGTGTVGSRGPAGAGSTGKGSKAQGRRAQRNARRVAEDYEDAFLDEF